MDYQIKDDRRFGYRMILIAVTSSTPLWIGLLFAGFWLRSFPACLIVLIVTLPLSLTIIAWKMRHASCPECSRQIKVNYRNEDYQRGGMLRYRCDDCRIIWRTFIFPGSGI